MFLYYIVKLSNVEREIKKNLLINKQLRDIFRRWFTYSIIYVLQVVACSQYIFVNKKVKLNVEWEQGLCIMPPHPPKKRSKKYRLNSKWKTEIIIIRFHTLGSLLP